MSQQGQIKKTEEKAIPFIKEAERQAEGAMDSVREVATETTAKAKELAENFGEELKNIPKIIRKYPTESVLVGFGVGIVSALLVRRLFD